MNFETISASNLDWYVGKNNYVIIDLRNRLSFERGQIRGAINIPFCELENQIGTLPRDKKLIFYCHRGSQSLMACNELSKMGYDVMDMSGGLVFYRGNNLTR